MRYPITVPPLTLRIGDLELRTCDENLLSRKALTKAEVVRWQETTIGGETRPSCYAVAIFSQDREGYWSVEFVGSRPFDVNREDFWRLLEFGQKFLSDVTHKARA